MRRATSGPQRRSYTLVILIVVTALVMMFVLVMARLTALEFVRQRQFTLQTWADEAVDSARDWGRLHAQELADDSAVRLPLNDLLPRGATDAVELQRGTSGDITVVRCRITVEQGRTRIRQAVAWPLPASSPR